jgi:hypothetical protein
MRTSSGAREVGDGSIDHRHGDHEPDRPGRRQALHEIGKGRGAHRAVRDERFDRGGRAIEGHALMPRGEQPPRHPRSHPAEADHPERHG